MKKTFSSTFLAIALLGATCQLSSANQRLYFPLAGASFPSNSTGEVGNNVQRTSPAGSPRPTNCKENCRTTLGDTYVALEGEMVAVAIAEGRMARQSDYPDFPRPLHGYHPIVNHYFTLEVEINGTAHLVRYMYLDSSPPFLEGQRVPAGAILSPVTKRNSQGIGPILYVEVHRRVNGVLQPHPSPLSLFRGASARTL